jgi:gliding motility-associated-like protein
MKKVMKHFSILLLSVGFWMSAQAAPVGGAVVVQGSGVSSDSVCTGTNSRTLTLQGYFGTIVRWEFSLTGNNPWITIANTAATYAVTNLNTSAYYRAVVVESSIEVASSATYIRVDQPSDAGLLSGDATVCSGANSGQVSLSGNTGRVAAWMFSFNTGGSWTVNAGITASSNAYSNLTQTTWYRTIVTNGACASDTTSIVKVTVNAPTIAGSVTTSNTTATINVCYGDNSGSLTLGGKTGAVVGWERAATSNGPWNMVFHNTASYTYTNLTETTYFRAIVSNSPCDTQRSAAAVVNVDPVTVPGSIAGDVDVCVGVNSGTLTLSNQVGSVTSWLRSTDNTSWTSVPNPQATLNYANLADTTWYKAIVKSGTCAADTSNSIEVKVNAASVAGTLSGASNVCSGSNSGAISLSGNTGEIVRWESATNSGGPWTALSATGSSVNYQNLVQTIHYRAVVKNPGCNTVYNSPFSIVVDPLSEAGSVTGATDVCVSGNSGVLRAAGAVGAASDWLISTNSGSNWSNASVAIDSISYSNLTTETWYRYINKSGTCPKDTSAIHKVRISSASVGGTVSGADTVCEGSNTGSLTLGGQTGSVLRWETAANPGGPWSSVTNATTAMNYSNLINSSFYRAVVASGACVEAASSHAYLRVVSAPVGGRISGTAQVCETQNSGLLVLNNFEGSIAKWQYSTNSGSNWTDTIHTGGNLTYSSLLQTTWYRVLVDAGVCGQTFSDTAVLTVKSQPVANFSAPDRCMNQSVTFTNLTLQGSNNAYTWTFGDGNSASTQNPLYQYSQPGVYSVTLLARSIDNCVSTISKNITIDTVPVADFTTQSVCLGTPIQTTNNSTPAGGSNNWDFGDGNNSSLSAPVYNYVSANVYNVKLTYTLANSCSAEKTVQINVYPKPTAVYTHPTVGESKAFTFTNSSFVSSGSLGYNWNFGDGNNSTVQNPTHTYSDTGDYTVRLITTTAYCSDTLEKTVVSNPVPVPNFGTANLCQGDSVTFTHTGFVKKGGLSFNWDFDDGTTSAIENPKHKFSGSGTYRVILTATSDSGFATTLSKNVVINPAPVPNFSAVSVCEDDTVMFQNASAISAGSMTYLWDFGFSGAGATTTNPSYPYTSGGNYSVTLTATSDKGCVDSIIKQVPVYYRPIVKFGTDTVCQGASTSFTDSTTVPSSSAASYLWDFGNGNGSSVRHPGFTFNTYGTYIVKLKVTSARGCIDSATQNVLVHALPVPVFTAPNTCAEDSVLFSNVSYHPLSAGMSYSWQFGDGSAASTATLPKHPYAQAGTYQAKLVVSVPSTGCRDSITHAIAIFPRGIPDFEVPGVCNVKSSVFTNRSSVSTGFMNYAWDFGDFSNSTATQPTHSYVSAGNYNVRLITTTNNGCRDTIFRTAYIYPQPETKFNVANVCNGDSLRPINVSTYVNGASIPDTTITYGWQFGDGQSSLIKSPVYRYGNAGNFKVTLTATTDSGCVSSIDKNVEIFALPIADFDVMNACEYDSLGFTSRAFSVYGATNHFWYFGDNGNAQVQNPMHKYAAYGTYSVKLEVVDKNFCVDSVRKNAIAHPAPVAAFRVEPVCDGESVAFDDTSSVASGSIQTHLWDFGDGTGSLVADASHLFLNDGTYSVRLRVTTDKGCIDDSVRMAVVNPLPVSDFSAKNECLNKPIPISNNSTIKSGFLTFKWYFEDGTSYEVNTPAHSPAKPAVYKVKLVSTSDQSCLDSLTRQAEVYPLPELAALKDTAVSMGHAFRLQATGAESYVWEPAQGLDNFAIERPMFDALATTDFVVQGTDENGCINFDTVTIEVKKDFQVYPAEVLTPNGDGVNDTWVIENIENYGSSKVQVLNRWGEPVFEQESYQNDWEGSNKNNDILPDGTYYYILTFSDIDRSYKGALTIMRNKK